MSAPLDHDTCSQLLRAYLSGEAGDDAPTVAAHLETCSQCREESAGLQMLLAPVEEMTPAERSHLHAEVARATRPESRSRVQAVPSRAPISERPPGRPAGSARARIDRRRLAPLLSAAAAILLVATGVVLFQHLEGSSGVASYGSAAAPDRAAGRKTNTAPQAIHGGGSSSLAVPTFAPSLLSDVGQVERAASTRLPLFRSAYAQTPVAQLAPGLLGRLADTAPAALRSQVLECGHQVIDQPGSTALPAYGARVTVRGEPILALAFTTPSSPAARLEIDGWALGSCQHRLVHRSVPASP
jgi:hypothetical protein